MLNLSPIPASPSSNKASLPVSRSLLSPIAPKVPGFNARRFLGRDSCNVGDGVKAQPLSRKQAPGSLVRSARFSDAQLKALHDWRSSKSTVDVNCEGVTESSGQDINVDKTQPPSRKQARGSLVRSPPFTEAQLQALHAWRSNKAAFDVHRDEVTESSRTLPSIPSEVALQDITKASRSPAPRHKSNLSARRRLAKPYIPIVQPFDVSKSHSVTEDMTSAPAWLERASTGDSSDAQSMHQMPTRSMSLSQIDRAVLQPMNPLQQRRRYITNDSGDILETKISVELSQLKAKAYALDVKEPEPQSPSAENSSHANNSQNQETAPAKPADEHNDTAVTHNSKPNIHAFDMKGPEPHSPIPNAPTVPSKPTTSSPPQDKTQPKSDQELPQPKDPTPKPTTTAPAPDLLPTTKQPKLETVTTYHDFAPHIPMPRSGTITLSTSPSSGAVTFMTSPSTNTMITSPSTNTVATSLSSGTVGLSTPDTTVDVGVSGEMGITPANDTTHSEPKTGDTTTSSQGGSKGKKGGMRAFLARRLSFKSTRIGS